MDTRYFGQEHIALYPVVQRADAALFCDFYEKFGAL